MAKTLLQIQQEVIEKYKVKIVEKSSEWGRMHANVRKREVHKWHPKASLQATFDLFHEIGHIMTTKSSMRRCESEFWATKWAIKIMQEYKLEIPEKTMIVYQAYIYMENARGMRRGASDNSDYIDIFQFVGQPKKYEEFMRICPANWKRAIEVYK